MIHTAATRSDAFITTIDSKNSPILSELRAKCSIMNRNRIDKNYRYRIVVRARLGKNNRFANLYKPRKNVNYLGLYKSSYIRHAHGTRFDIYLYSEYVGR